MTWLFLLAAGLAAVFMLPGGGRTVADRRVAQAVAVSGLAAACFAAGLAPFGVIILIGGIGLLAIGFRRETHGGDGFQNLDDESVSMGHGRFRPEMSRAEALSVLGLSLHASQDEIIEAYRRLMVKAHPDAGGSDYLAAKINEARDILLPD